MSSVASTSDLDLTAQEFAEIDSPDAPMSSVIPPANPDRTVKEIIEVASSEAPAKERLVSGAKKMDQQHVQSAMVVVRFDYSPLEMSVVERVRAAADRIRQLVKKTVDDVIKVGMDLLAVKETLGHGQFGDWLRAEFGWTERSARNFMAVADRFGKSEMISDLRIQPTAAYLLAAPSAPDEARDLALQRAGTGEQITTAVAKEILAKTRKKQRRKTHGRPLAKVLERYREQCQPKERSALARQLREFADQLDGNGLEK